MISLLIEAALRSLLFGLVVAIGLRAFRVRNVVAQKAAWTFVLVAAFAMPLLRPVTARWRLLPAGANILLPAHPMTLLEELQAKIQAHSGSGSKSGHMDAGIPQEGSPWAEQPSASVSGPAQNPHARETQPGTARARQKQTAVAPVRHGVGLVANQSSSRLNRIRLTLSGFALGLYLCVAALLVFRLVLGLTATLRLWSTATAIPAHTMSGFPASLRLRASIKIHSPVTIGSAILLPADYESWDAEKLHIVLAHERSHVRQGDFYLQLLAGLYAALVWLSPLGWWLKRELADLGEVISDRAGIEAAQSRTSYAQILLEFAAMPRPTAIGVAMARPGSLGRRIERFLNDHAFRQSFAGGRRALVTVALVPLALFAAAAMVRVEAAPVAHSAKKALLASAASLSVLSTAPEPQAAGLAEQQIAEDQQVSDFSVEGTPMTALPSPAPAPEPELQGAALPEIAAAPPVLSLFRIAALAPAPVAAAESDGSSLSFDRTLSVNGEAQLMVSTGSGNIRLTHGSATQIRIHGQIHTNREASEEEARSIATNPPIEQNGNLIRVGPHEEHWRGISIDYEIEAPAETLLGAISGSGDIFDEGVGQNAKLETGSGDIRASGLQGPFLVKTGSGNITAEQTGQGDVKAETGSGNIEIKDIHGGFRAQTGSGDIKATGTPSALWTLQTGSGNIDLWPGNAPLTLDASTGSGSVTTDREMLVKGSLDRNHITGNLNGGGPTVRAQTGSGDIHIY
jgi:beta-lactamase regulating signal transducer with metallopeptidase domain